MLPGISYAIAGKKVLVTGASSGIGAALAEGLAERGAIVGICARRADRLRDVLDRVRTHSPDSRSWTVDLSQLDRVAVFARRADEELDGIDVLVNNAGIPKRRRVTELTPDVVDAVMAINYLSPVRLTLALLPGLVERDGRIVNISSVAARLGPGTEAAYAASKAALTAWSEAMAIDLADTGVKVHVVNPGVIDTELFRLPDNDEPIADMSMALPAEAIVQPVLDQLDAGAFEIYVPDWFQDVVAGKVADPDGFQQGTIAYLRSQGVLGAETRGSPRRPVNRRATGRSRARPAPHRSDTGRTGPG
jgi:NAD(P)-dependent dehydrogenase (short-subunit alcohol dehydrogenase family)